MNQYSSSDRLASSYPVPDAPFRSGSDLQERGLGLLFLLIGGFLGYIGIYSPLQKAMHHAPEVSLSLKSVVLTPFALFMGMLLLGMGKQARAIIGERNRLTPIGWVITLVFVGIGFALHHWLEAQLRGYGYAV